MVLDPNEVEKDTQENMNVLRIYFCKNPEVILDSLLTRTSSHNSMEIVSYISSPTHHLSFFERKEREVEGL